MIEKKSSKKSLQQNIQNQFDFTLVDNAIINLIVEKTKLNKEKYSLILSKTVIIYIILIALAIYSTVNQIISQSILSIALVLGTILLFIVYLYVIEHFDKIDKDIDEVVNLLQTKILMKKK